MSVIKHPEYRAAIQAIAEAPDDLAHHLILADWLEEHDEQERGRFIRLQCELYELESIEHDCGEDGEWTTTCPACGASSFAQQLSDTEREFIIEFGLDKLSGLEEIPITAGDFRRGLLESVTMKTEKFLEIAGVLFCAHPVQRVVLSDRKPYQLNRTAAPVWYCPIGGTSVVSLPPPIYENYLYRDRGIVPILFETPEAADDALSSACVAWGRNQAKSVEVA